MNKVQSLSWSVSSRTCLSVPLTRPISLYCWTYRLTYSSSPPLSVSWIHTGRYVTVQQSTVIPFFVVQELFGGYDGVHLVINYLRKDIANFSSGLGHHRLLLAATDCIWCTVVGNPIVEDIFLESEGVLILLDILQVSLTN